MHIRRVTDAMLRRLGTNHIDLLYQHRVDTAVDRRRTRYRDAIAVYAVVEAPFGQCADILINRQTVPVATSGWQCNGVPRLSIN